MAIRQIRSFGLAIIGLVLAAHAAAGPLHDAAAEGDLPVVEQLIVEGSDPNAVDAMGYTPMHLAAMEGHDNVVEWLSVQGADIDSANNKAQRTPLHVAARYGQVAIAAWLLENGAAVDSTDAKGYTPLFVAIGEGDHPDVAALLIEQGAEVNVEDALKGQTPLHATAFKGHVEGATLLLDHGAEVDPKIDDGTTPLHWACLRNQTDVAALLIERGADITAKGGGGGSPLHVAAHSGDIANTIANPSRKPMAWTIVRGISGGRVGLPGRFTGGNLRRSEQLSSDQTPIAIIRDRFGETVFVAILFGSDHALCFVVEQLDVRLTVAIEVSRFPISQSGDVK